MMAIPVNFILVSIDTHLSVDIIDSISIHMHASVDKTVSFHIQTIYAFEAWYLDTGKDHTVIICSYTALTYEVISEIMMELSISRPPVIPSVICALVSLVAHPFFHSSFSPNLQLLKKS